MKILILTQVFYPDNVSVSQHLSDLAFYLQKNGHDVSVISSIYNYEDKFIKYKKKEDIDGVKILRLNQSSLGKQKTHYRIIDFLTFYFNILFKILFLNRNDYDIIIGTTVPPLLSFCASLMSKFKKIKFVYWVMDLQPELSIHSGLIKKNSLIANFLTIFGNYSIKYSSKIISLDHFMTKYLISRGADENKIFTIPVWPVIDKKYEGSRLENPFRLKYKFDDKIIIMYSGNHAFVHPLDTILETAYKLKNDNRFIFVFVGGGVRKSDVTNFKNKHELNNIVQLPFQPRENIHLSLGSSDLQVVILGDGQVGYTHPNKIYGALYVGKPIIYIGPMESHVSDILSNLEGNISVKHGESFLLHKKLLEFVQLRQDEIQKIGNQNYLYANSEFNPEILKQKMLDAICSN